MSDSQENVTGKVVIKDSSIKAVEVMLRYIYTGDIPCYLGEEENLHLLQLADMYHLERLKIACGGNIVNRISISKCISNYITISRYFGSDPDNRFKKMVNKFMWCQAEQVMKQDDWKELLREYPDVVDDVVQRGKDGHGCMFCTV